jgi:hypothetical protein
MLANPGILTSEPLDLSLVQMPTESDVQLSGEIVVEFGKELDVEEEHRRGCQFIGHHIKKHLRAIVFVLEVGALLGLDSRETHLDDVASVAEEDGFSTCTNS